MATIGFVSLGCPKALVDSENILTSLKAEGYAIVNDYATSDLVVVNTCGFIDAAVEESMAAIGEALKENGKVIVTGCLGAKEGIISTKFPNVLGVTGPHAQQEVLNLIHKFVPKPHDPFTDLVPPQGIKLTPQHYAYLKISEGCNNSCSFCIIPSMRGKLNSYPIGEILSQAEKLVAAGVKELLVISQDTGAYGLDKKYIPGFYNGRPIKTKFIDLCQELAKLGIWIRLHYIYPYPHIDDLIPLMATGKILPYLDIPLQHASPQILKAMKRPGNATGMLERIAAWRALCPDLALRSTFIVGFPGETEEDFQILLDFLDAAQLDKVGCFQYSPVEGAPANSIAALVPDNIKKERYQRLMLKQQEISLKKLQAKIGTTQLMIIDKITRQQIIGRSKYDAPEIDGLIYIKHRGQYPMITVGDIIAVDITASMDYDLYAVPTKSN
jgi:ribosomal protein S12 methylthiotransferase